MAVLMPMRRPLLSSKTPPELPGFIAASVWMTLRIGIPLAPAHRSRQPSELCACIDA